MSAQARARWSVGQAFLIGLIFVYRHTLAYLVGGQCRFYPSCSCYAGEAVRMHGAWRGLGLTAARLVRCHPFHVGGYDPVPSARAVSGELQ